MTIAKLFMKEWSHLRFRIPTENIIPLFPSHKNKMAKDLLQLSVLVFFVSNPSHSHKLLYASKEWEWKKNVEQEGKLEKEIDIIISLKFIISFSSLILQLRGIRLR